MFTPVYLPRIDVPVAVETRMSSSAIARDDVPRGGSCPAYGRPGTAGDRDAVAYVSQISVASNVSYDKASWMFAVPPDPIEIPTPPFPEITLRASTESPPMTLAEETPAPPRPIP